MIATILNIGIFLFGVLAGFALAWARAAFHKSLSLNCGEIIVNTTDADKDVLKFALDVPVVELMNANSVTFKVVKEDSV